MTLFRILIICLSIGVSACAFIQQGSVRVVEQEPTECEFIAYLPHTFADSYEEGINKLKRETIRREANTLFLPPDKQTVLAKRVGGRFLSIGSAYRCPDAE